MTATIEQRIETLERQNRRLKLLGGSTIGLALVGRKSGFDVGSVDRLHPPPCPDDSLAAPETRWRPFEGLGCEMSRPKRPTALSGPLWRVCARCHERRWRNPQV